MKNSIFFTNNSEDTLAKLKENGFHICSCCTFENAKWLHFYYRTLTTKEPVKEFHGVGFGCENECIGMSTEKCIRCAVTEGIDNSNTMIFNDLDDMISFINGHYCNKN